MMPPEARRLSRLAVSWAALADTIPLYALYALLFADSGLSQGQISILFIIWSAVGFAAEIPTGALADRFSRRSSVIASTLLTATGFLLWIVSPGFTSFAVGFVIWGLGGALASGAFEALVYEGLAEVGAEEHYPRVNGWVNAALLLTQIPVGIGATVLFSVGGYSLVGWVSIGVCLAASLLATRLPEPARLVEQLPGTGYLTSLRRGFVEAFTHPPVRAAVIAVAVIGGLDALEEYFPLMASDWGVPTAMVPLALLGIPLAGAAGAAVAGAAARLSPGRLTTVFAGALMILGAAALIALPAGLAGVAVFYALHQMILVVVEGRLQDQISGPSRATVTSASSLGTELVAILLFAAWAPGGLMLIVGLWLLGSIGLAHWLKVGSTARPL